MADNKAKLFSLKNVHYAMLTDAATPTFDTPVAIPGAITLAMDPDGDLAKLFADDAAYATAAVNNGYTGSLEVALLTDAVKADWFGWRVDAIGGLVEVSTAQPAAFALMFEFAGDQRSRRVVLYNCIASRPKDDLKTKTEKAEFATDALSLLAMPLEIDGEMTPKYHIERTTLGATAYDAWYDAVTLPTADAVS